jgi:hypothetical protein
MALRSATLVRPARFASVVVAVAPSTLRSLHFKVAWLTKSHTKDLPPQEPVCQRFLILI